MTKEKNWRLNGFNVSRRGLYIYSFEPRYTGRRALGRLGTDWFHWCRLGFWFVLNLALGQRITFKSD